MFEKFKNYILRNIYAYFLIVPFLFALIIWTGDSLVSILIEHSGVCSIRLFILDWFVSFFAAIYVHWRFLKGKVY